MPRHGTRIARQKSLESCLCVCWAGVKGPVMAGLGGKTRRAVVCTDTGRSRMTKEVQLSVVSRRGSQGLWELAGETSFSASGEEVSSLQGCPRQSRLLLGQ